MFAEREFETHRIFYSRNLRPFRANDAKKLLLRNSISTTCLDIFQSVNLTGFNVYQIPTLKIDVRAQLQPRRECLFALLESNAKTSELTPHLGYSFPLNDANILMNLLTSHNSTNLPGLVKINNTPAPGLRFDYVNTPVIISALDYSAFLLASPDVNPFPKKLYITMPSAALCVKV